MRPAGVWLDWYFQSSRVNGRAEPRRFRSSRVTGRAEPGDFDRAESPVEPSQALKNKNLRRKILSQTFYYLNAEKFLSKEDPINSRFIHDSDQTLDFCQIVY